jgi:hypothetical protein
VEGTYRLQTVPESDAEWDVLVAGLEFWPTGEAQAGKRPQQAEYRVGRISFLGKEIGYGAFSYSLLPFAGKPHLRLARTFASSAEAKAYLVALCEAEIAELRTRRRPYLSA